MTVRKTAEQARLDTQEQFRKMVEPYHGRCIQVFDQPKKLNIHSFEIWTLYNPEADEADDRHSLRGMVMVEFWRDGGATVFWPTEVVRHLAAIPADVAKPNTWNEDRELLARMLPSRPKFIE